MHFPSASVFSPQQFQKCGEQSRNLKHNMSPSELQVPNPSLNLLPHLSQLLRASSSCPESLGAFPDSSFSLNLPPPNPPAARPPFQVSPESKPSPTATATTLSPSASVANLHPLSQYLTGSWCFLLNHKADCSPVLLKAFPGTQVLLHVRSWSPA